MRHNATDAAFRVSDKAFWVGIGMILAAALATRSFRLDADAPTNVGRDYALTTDGSWYTARALDGAIGRECDVTSSYDRAPFTFYTSTIYAIFGPSLASTNFVSVPPSILAILFSALAARALSGNVGGLLAAVFLGSNYSFFVFNRNPVIYSFLTMITALVFWLVIEARRREKAWISALAWTTAVAAVVSVKEIVIFAMPVLLLAWPIPELLRRRPIVSIVTLSVAAAVSVAGGLAFDLHLKFGQKLHDYLPEGGLSELWSSAMGLEERGGFFRALPILAPIALCAGSRRQLSWSERGLWCVIALPLLAFLPFQYSPLRYTVIVFPAVAILAASRLARLGGPTDPIAPPAPRWWRASQTAVLILLAATVSRWLANGSTGAWVALWIATGGSVLALLWLPASRLSLDAISQRFSWTRARVVSVSIAAAVVATLGVDVFRTSSAFAASRYTTREAITDLPSIVGEGAVISGLFSHVLTTENHVDRTLVSAARFGNERLRKTYERRGTTHLTLPRADYLPELLERFRVDAARLEFVHSFQVRDIEILLFRFEFAESYYQLSEYERGAEALEAENPDQACAHFEESVRTFPNSAAARSALATARLAAGELSAAQRRAEEALERNPWDLRALGVLADIALRSGHLAEARTLLERMSSLRPGDERVEKTLEELARAGVTN